MLENDQTSQTITPWYGRICPKLRKMSNSRRLLVCSYVPVLRMKWPAFPARPHVQICITHALTSIHPKEEPNTLSNGGRLGAPIGRIRNGYPACLKLSGSTPPYTATALVSGPLNSSSLKSRRCRGFSTTKSKPVSLITSIDGGGVVRIAIPIMTARRMGACCDSGALPAEVLAASGCAP